MKLGEALTAISDDQSVRVSISNCGLVVTVLGHGWVFAVPRGRSALVLVCHGAEQGLEGHTLAADLTNPADCPGCRDHFQTVKPTVQPAAQPQHGRKQ